MACDRPYIDRPYIYNQISNTATKTTFIIPENNAKNLLDHKFVFNSFLTLLPKTDLIPNNGAKNLLMTKHIIFCYCLIIIYLNFGLV